MINGHSRLNQMLREVQSQFELFFRKRCSMRGAPKKNAAIAGRA
jgi:hypothetical protein